MGATLILVKLQELQEKANEYSDQAGGAKSESLEFCSILTVAVTG